MFFDFQDFEIEKNASKVLTESGAGHYKTFGHHPQNAWKMFPMVAIFQSYAWRKRVRNKFYKHFCRFPSI